MLQMRASMDGQTVGFRQVSRLSQMRIGVLEMAQLPANFLSSVLLNAGFVRNGGKSGRISPNFW